MQNFLNLQCLHDGILFPYWARKWINIRKLFANWFGVRRCNILKMLEYFGLEFEGKQHCGLDDAKNIARILVKLVENGCPIKINEKIKEPYTEIEKKPNLKLLTTSAFFDGKNNSESNSNSDNEKKSTSN
jgi:inhibitor of KinA sporulation pathway (predicted exonuclease)